MRRQGVAGIPGLDQLAGPAATTDDPDLEQAVAEVALGCLGFDRVEPVVTERLAADDDLVGIDPACLAREVSSLQDTPDILAAMLRRRARHHLGDRRHGVDQLHLTTTRFGRPRGDR